MNLSDPSIILYRWLEDDSDESEKVDLESILDNLNWRDRVIEF
jgi:hypothetical protein